MLVFTWEVTNMMTTVRNLHITTELANIPTETILTALLLIISIESIKFLHDANRIDIQFSASIITLNCIVI